MLIDCTAGRNNEECNVNNNHLNTSIIIQLLFINHTNYTSVIWHFITDKDCRPNKNTPIIDINHY